MFRRLVLAVLLLISCCVLGRQLALAESRKEAEALFQEANVLRRQAQSHDALKRVEEKYKQALQMLERLGDKKACGDVANNLGAIYWSWGDYDQAIHFYEKALDSARAARDQKSEAVTLSNLAVVYMVMGQTEKATGMFEKALGMSRKLRDLRGEGACLNNLGLIRRKQGLQAEAQKLFDGSLQIARKTKDKAGEALALRNLGNVHFDRGDFAAAERLYDESLRMARTVKNPMEEASALNALGYVYRSLGQYLKGIESWQQALAISRKLGDTRAAAGTIRNLGDVYSDMGQYANAYDMYEESLEMSRKTEDRSEEASTLNGLGNLFSEWGQYAKALDYFETSLQICKTQGEASGEANALGNMGILYKNWGQFTRAAELYNKSLEIRRRIGDAAGQGAVLHNLGTIYSAWGSHTEALDLYEKALETWRKVGGTRAEETTLRAMGWLYVQIEDYDKALDSFRKSLAVREKLGISTDFFSNDVGSLYIEMGQLEKAEPLLKQAGDSAALGRLCLLKLDYKEAEKYYEGIRVSAEESRGVNNLFTGNTGLGLAFEGMSDLPQAAEHFRKAVELTEDLRSGLTESEREHFFDVKVGGFLRTAPYEGLARVLTKMNRPLEALKESEHTKARLFAEAMGKRARAANVPIPKDVLENDSALNEQLGALSRNLQKAFEKERKETIAVLEPQVKEAKEKLAAHVAMLREQYPLFAATKYPKPMEIAQTALRDDEWVLSYDVTDPGVLIYLTKGKQVVKGLFKPIPRKEVDELVRTFREPMELGPDGMSRDQLARFDFAAGKKLADLLLGDILTELPKDAALIIVPDDSLGVLPFEMLVLNDSGRVVDKTKFPTVTGAEFFGDRNPISYYQSITALTLARTLGKQAKPGDKALAMVDPVFNPDDKRLVQVDKERRAKLMASLPEVLMSIETDKGLVFPRLPLTGDLGRALKKADPTKTELKDGLNAQKQALMQKDLSPFRSVVFATHGYFGKDLPGIQEPVLVLTLLDQPKDQDGFLRLSEVLGLNINADVVALTACQTGLGKVISGEGTMGMGRAFQFAGARSVMMSLWSVAETSSVNLVETFFKHLKDGKPKLEALKLARAEIRAQGYDHPFFWAPFILVGEVR